MGCRLVLETCYPDLSTSCLHKFQLSSKAHFKYYQSRRKPISSTTSPGEALPSSQMIAPPLWLSFPSAILVCPGSYLEHHLFCLLNLCHLFFDVSHLPFPRSPSQHLSSICWKASHLESWANISCCQVCSVHFIFTNQCCQNRGIY